ncbi:MAG TPA: ABC transporter substrate-binding protein [Rhodopila sp.]|uniref:ABC transporter substrate-binding protein n=1 Tax=Rhodopila sp. TaxID=2480087 RepID=UPI002BEE6610|nr:ABC transporter substrate-binding protein [Rhodopila sp.]HVY14862.1 ABC transporter substrate-binding protein [Rhodopila sp.]
MRLHLSATLAALLLAGGAARAATDIDMYFPVPVQGKLAVEMQKVIGDFNKSHPDINVTAVYTGSYDDTNLKTHAAIKAGKPPAVVIMSANFVREYVIDNEIENLDPLIAKDGQTVDQFESEFWPALKLNSTEGGHVYGVPFQNSTPLLYYSVDAFKDAGLDPNKPPVTWQDFVTDAKKLVKRDDGNTTRWGFMMPGTYDYCGWITSALAMSNGGDFYNTGYGGEVYYNTPTTIGAVKLLDNLVHKDKAMPEGVTDANAVTTAFFQGRLGMMVLSTGALSFVRDNMKTPYRTAFLPRALVNAAPIGGASLILPKGNSPEREAAAWTLMKWLVSPEVAGRWSRFTGYFAPRIAAYDLPDMKSFMAAHPNAKVALDQLQYARGWFSTYNVVGVRKALEDGVQAVLAGKATPEAAMAKAQQEADALLRPYVEQTALKVPE